MSSIGCRSLAKLGLDYVDCYLVHNPRGAKIIETCPSLLDPSSCGPRYGLCFSTLHAHSARVSTVAGDAMLAIKAAGKAKSVGVSNFGIEQLQGLKAA